MQTVGSVLRAERLRQGLTIDAISVETKISAMRLQALEADELGCFSSPFFYKSFVKQVAQRLRVEEKSIAQMLNAQAASIPAPLVPGEEERQLPKVPALDGVAERPRTRWLIPTASLVVVLAASSGVFELWQHGGTANNKGAAGLLSPSALGATHPASPAALPEPPQSKPDAAQAAQPAPADSIVKEPETGNAAPAPLAKSPVQLELAALESVWISVVSDGKFIYSGVLNRAESKSFSSHAVARIKVGNAGVVNIKYNGRKIGPLGARGSVCTAVFTATNFEIVEPQPHVELTQYVHGNE
jgi:cytoskeleton protein RodZ